MPRQPAKATQLADALALQIENGTLKPGTWLPSWANLAAQHGVVISTVRRALAMLADRDLIELVPGRGAIVGPSAGMTRQASDVTRQEGAWRGFLLSVVEAGAEPFTDTVIRDTGATAEIASWLAVPIGTTVVERDRTQGQMVDGQREPLQIATTWFSPQITGELPILRQLSTGPGGMYSRMTDAGHVLRWEDTVTERVATSDERSRLGLSRGAHVLLIWRRCYNQDQRILEATRRAIRSDRSPVVYRYE
ncbi:GntR family transcriptional regulator [Pseudofrankia inefficax]|uniref:Transcriptional regulator, GntR family n=1 Tax=Pseudofrankia inefficax (strain DSM 45817 / CECT 9037 / DDB 130130 / EuI1c) TaxID=298654 RepID=E3IX01_PSEI1|nr:GntR family transcriptional regulator [Pseudofrankia inefficax]ADP82625.1 transcriptional regulator, GntR family [Pseudofrankia inefficax]